MGIIVSETNRLPRYSRPELAGFGVVRTANGNIQRKADGQIKRASKAYITVDPTALAEKLEAAGFKLGKMAHFRSIWKFGWEVLFPEGDCGPSNDPYRTRAKILCVHNGREAFRVFPGAMRVACLNQFHGEAWSIRHTDAELRRFLEDPAGCLFNMRDAALGVLNTVESFRGIRLPVEYGLCVTGRPRLGATVQTWLRQYRLRHGEVGKPWVDAWDLCQALTEAKKPTATEAASVLIRNADTVRAGGRVDDYFKIWEPERPAADPAIVQAIA